LHRADQVPTAKFCGKNRSLLAIARSWWTGQGKDGYRGQHGKKKDSEDFHESQQRPSLLDYRLAFKVSRRVSWIREGTAATRPLYWPDVFSILLATFTPLNPLTYLEMPR
jgi:hypothetical protein